MLRRNLLEDDSDDDSLNEDDDIVYAKKAKIDNTSDVTDSDNVKKSSKKKKKKIPSKTVEDVDEEDLGYDSREMKLEEEVLGMAENLIDSLPEISSKKRKKKRKKAEEEDIKKWADSDDEEKEEFDTITPDWAATFDDEKSDDSDDEILKAHSLNTMAPPTSLPSAALDFKRITDGNKEEPSKASLTNVEFHPKATVLLTGGPDCTVRLFAVDGSKNRKIHSLFVDQTPVYKCHFSLGGSEIIIGSKHKSFYVFDLDGSEGVTFRPKVKGLEIANTAKFEVSPDGRFLAFLGKDGYIHLFSQKSKELIQSLKMNESVESVSFSKDGRLMYSFGAEGVVYKWDMNTRDCIHSFSDEGCVNGTCVSVSPDEKYLVCGSRSGIVNIYDADSAALTRHPKPIKLIKNLTTACHGATFNSTSEILALHSSDLEKAIRLVHLPSLSALPNFPEQFDHEMSMVKAVDFSPSSGYLALGNNRGRCLLYRLQHYKKY